MKFVQNILVGRLENSVDDVANLNDWKSSLQHLHTTKCTTKRKWHTRSSILSRSSSKLMKGHSASTWVYLHQPAMTSFIRRYKNLRKQAGGWVFTICDILRQMPSCLRLLGPVGLSKTKDVTQCWQCCFQIQLRWLRQISLKINETVATTSFHNSSILTLDCSILGSKCEYQYTLGEDIRLEYMKRQVSTSVHSWWRH